MVLDYSLTLLLHLLSCFRRNTLLLMLLRAVLCCVDASMLLGGCLCLRIVDGR